MLHKLFHKDVLNRIKLIISDGDQQECGSIDNAIGMFMKGAKRARCGWHIVNQFLCQENSSLVKHGSRNYDLLCASRTGHV